MSVTKMIMLRAELDRANNALEAKDQEIAALGTLIKSTDKDSQTVRDEVITMVAESLAKDQRIAELEAALRDFPTIAKSAPALIKRIKTEFLPRRRKLLEASEDTRKEAPE